MFESTPITSALLSELVARFGGTLIGNDCTIIGTAALNNAQPQQLSFALASVEAKQLQETQASAVIVAPKWKTLLQSSKPTVAMIVTDHPYLLFAKCAALFYSQPSPASHAPQWVQSSTPLTDKSTTVGAFTVIESSVKIGSQSCIGSHCWLGKNVRIGRRALIYPHVSIYPGSIIGDDVIIHSGTIIGADGYGFVPDPQSKMVPWYKIPQTCGVVIGNGVEVGALCTIDRGAFSDTQVGDGCKLDNGVHIGHGSHIGKHTLFMAHAIIGGSVTIEDHCIIGAMVAVAPSRRIAAGTTVSPSSVVSRHLDKKGGRHYSGRWPIQAHDEWLRTQKRVMRLGQKTSSKPSSQMPAS